MFSLKFSILSFGMWLKVHKLNQNLIVLHGKQYVDQAAMKDLLFSLFASQNNEL